MATAIVFDPHYLDHETGVHPENPQRLKAIEQAFERRGIRSGTLPMAPRAATRAELERVHTAEMIDQVEAACRSGEGHLDADTVVCADSFVIACEAAGGALAGVDALFRGHATNAFLMARPPGHHATPEVSMGFCLFNNVAVAARYAQAVYGVERVLILDWDVHHGNGTQDAFYEDPSVYYVSWHQSRLYPGTGFDHERGAGKGTGTTRNVPLKAFTRPADYQSAFRATLEDVTRGFEPDLVIVSAGFDAHAQDPLGSLLLQDEDFRVMTEEVLELAQRYAKGRLLSALEGGYNLATLGDTVATHVETLKGA